MAGSHCAVFQYWSQCQENEIENSDESCVSTFNGPFGGPKWGCSVNSDCCNEAAMCGTDRRCSLPCGVHGEDTVLGAVSEGSKGMGNERSNQVVALAILFSLSVCLAVLVCLNCRHFQMAYQTAPRSKELPKWVHFENVYSREEDINQGNDELDFDRYIIQVCDSEV